MAMDVPQIRSWLLLQPRAHTIKVLTTDDRNHEVACNTGASWMALATSIHALEPALVEAYDSEGKIIRAVRPLEQNTARPDGTTTPAPLVMPAGTDPQSMLLLHFADLLAQAYRHSTDVAFERLASLFEAVNRRSESLERTIEKMERLLLRAHEEQVENAAPKTEEDGLREMVASFMQGYMQRDQNGATNGSNGKAA